MSNGKSSSQAHAQRSNVQNPNNPAHHASQVNRGNQMNPQHAAHPSHAANPSPSSLPGSGATGSDSGKK